MSMTWYTLAQTGAMGMTTAPPFPLHTTLVPYSERGSIDVSIMPMNSSNI